MFCSVSAANWLILKQHLGGKTPVLFWRVFWSLIDQISNWYRPTFSTTATISHYTAQHWMWSVLYHNNVNSPRRRTPRSGGEGQRKAPPTWWGPPTSAPARVESHSLRLDPLEVDLQAQLKGESFTGTNINTKKTGKWAEPIRSKRLNPTIIRIEYLNFWIFKLVL